MTNVVSLAGEKADIGTRCIEVAEMCERVASQARAGIVVAASIAFVTADGCACSLWEGRGHFVSLVGATAIMNMHITSGAGK